MKRIAAWTVAIMIGAVLAIQLISIEQTNPPVETVVPASAEIRAVLRRACYDCHSNETVWPWYSRIAPVSWQMARDVKEGREALNFSTWNRLDTSERIELVHESVKEVEEGEMPPWFYLLPHPEARLSSADRSLLLDWAATLGPRESDDD